MSRNFSKFKQREWATKFSETLKLPLKNLKQGINYTVNATGAGTDEQTRTRLKKIAIVVFENSL